MSRILGLLVITFVLTVGGSSYAQPNRTVVQAIGAPSNTDTSTLRGGTWADAYVTVTCYYGTSVPKNICAGGGDFDRVDHTDSGCSSSSDNWGTIIKDHVGNCFYRKNWGLNGVVDARQCGVVGDGAADDTDALNKCLSLAAVPTSTQPAVPIVSTGGGQLRIDGTGTSGSNVVMQDGITLSCGGGSSLGVVTKNDYTTAQHAIWLFNDGTHTSTISGGASAAVDGCVILRGNGNHGAPYDYAPNMFVPTTANGGLRSSLTEVAHFAGTAITANSESFTVRNSTILGFAQCWQGDGNRLTVQNTKCDGTAGFWVSNSGGGVSLDSTQIRAFLTGNGFTGTCINCSSYTWQYITGTGMPQDFISLTRDTSNNQYQAKVDIGTSSTDPRTPVLGDTIWIGTPTTNAQSAGGRYVLGTVSAPAFCIGSSGDYCVSFDLPGSVYSDSTNYVSATASFSAGSNVLTNLNVDVRTLAVGMHVGSDPSTGCIHDTTTATATIADINPAWNTVWITPATPATCDSGSNANVRFWDDTYGSSPPAGATVTLSATERTGDAYKVTNTGGATFSNCRQIGHYVGFHAGDNSNLTRFVNCANDNDSTLQDDALIGLLCDGEHYGLDCSDTDWVNGVLGQHASGSIVIDSDSTHAVHVANAGIGGLTNGRQRSRFADVEAGVLALDNSTAGSGEKANVFLSNGPHLVTFVRDSNGNVIASNYAVGDVITDSSTSGSSCSIHPEITIDSVGTVGGNSGVPLTWHQSRQGVCATWPSPNPGWATTCTGVGSGCTGLCPSCAATGSTENAAAQLAMSNVLLKNGLLYLQDKSAAGSTSGCGNVFQTPVPFTCSDAPSAPMPGGRLTLTRTQPVMQGDVTGATTLYYVPYLTQQAPIYNLTANAFAPVDITSNGIPLNLDSSNQTAGHLYDVFLETVHTGSPELCVGPAWSSNSSRGTGYNSTEVTQVNGVWVNAFGFATCEVSPGSPAVTTPCPIYACTYLGTIYTTANGQTSQQFNLNPGSGGKGPCLCLYNAYNQVTVSSQSLDSQGAYTYNSATWRVMGNPANPLKNYITVVDGLGQMPVSAKLSDAILVSAITNSGAFGINFNTTSGQPGQIARASPTAISTYTAGLVHAPQKGLWTAQAMEAAPAGTATLGGSGLQQLSVQVAD